ncbi:MAG TPA: SpoIVB peptidase S55 domain-containing protein, partial [Synergistales bacterium]|nr:SpoIVB peptidase S55 domain-containing protein [Synergistales bacterium]
MRKTWLFLVVAMILLSFPGVVYSGEFVVPGGIMGVDSLREGMQGTAWTVVKGGEVVSFPVKILSVLPEPTSPRNLILIRASGPVIEKTGGIAAGMSGSPVFVGGKLIGAIGYGWNFSEHEMGLVTPIEDILSIWDWPDRVPGIVLPDLELKDPDNDDPDGSEDETPADLADSGDKMDRELSAPLVGMGYSARSAKRIEEILGMPVVMIPGDIRGNDIPVEFGAVARPGEAVSVLV